MFSLRGDRHHCLTKLRSRGNGEGTLIFTLPSSKLFLSVRARITVKKWGSLLMGQREGRKQWPNVNDTLEAAAQEQLKPPISFLTKILCFGWWGEVAQPPMTKSPLKSQLAY